MHIGATSGSGLSRPMLHLGGRTDGAISPDGKVFGCYLHGLFASDAFRDAFLARIRSGRGKGIAYEEGVEQTLEALADHLDQTLDVDALAAAAASFAD
jgi:adenosylcobyric acid synthase